MRKFELVKNAPNSIIIPSRKTEKSAGYDICTPIEVDIMPHQFIMIPTYVKANINDDEFVMVVPRSSLYKKHGLFMINSVGIIDADYAGNIENDGNMGVLLLNNTNEIQTLKKDEAIAQCIILNYLKTDDDIAEGERVGGFGSTDKQ